MIENMNSKMTRSQLSTTKPKKNPKNKLSKQLEQEQNHRNGDHMEGYQHRNGDHMKEEWEGERGGKGTENKYHKW